MTMPARLSRHSALLGALSLVILPMRVAVASTPALVSTAAIGNAVTLAAASGTSPVYVATTQGLFRSASSTYAQWTQQSAITDIGTIVPNPQRPDDLVYATGPGIYRSVDGGRTATLTKQCGIYSMVRAPSSPSALYATSLVQAGCASGPTGPGYYGPAAILRSKDDGITWTAVYTADLYYDGNEGFGPLAVDPRDPAYVVAVEIYPHAYEQILKTTDGGQTWGLLPSRGAGAMAFVYRTAQGTSDLWFGNSDSDIERNFVPVNTGAGLEVGAFAFDPLTQRVYVSDIAEHRILASDPYEYIDRGLGSDIPAPGNDYGAFEPFAELQISVGADLVIMRNGYLIAVGNGTPLVVRKLINSNTWDVAPQLLAGYLTVNRAQLLGGTLSPRTVCDGTLCQYFDKGALEVRNRGTYIAYSLAALVPRLIGSQITLPVGGTTSSVSYKTLYELHARRTSAPAGFQHGTASVAGGTFIPYSPQLTAASGYVVPPYFWQYMSNSDLTPDGWMRDVGLPLTNAVAATVTKGKLGTRSIMLQAFQYAVLTYDPKNAAPFRVERANVGMDYAAAFPQAVR